MGELKTLIYFVTARKAHLSLLHQCITTITLYILMFPYFIFLNVPRCVRLGLGCHVLDSSSV